MPNGTKPLGSNSNMEKDTNMNKKIIVGSLVGCVFGATVGYSASVVSLPHTFVSGTPIKASEVNANFSALAHDISTLDSSLLLNRSSNFTDVSINTQSMPVGSTVTIGGKSFIIKQKSNIEDPITGKVYTINYPQVETESGGVTFVTGCRQHVGTSIIISRGSGNGFVNYISYYKSEISGGFTRTAFYIQTNNLCTSLTIENGVDLTRTTAVAMMNRAIELQKYIFVQEV